LASVTCAPTVNPLAACANAGEIGAASANDAEATAIRMRISTFPIDKNEVSLTFQG
jgi:hypothetical protein